MKNLNELRKMLYDIDGRGYKAYKSLEGIYERVAEAMVDEYFAEGDK